MLFEGHTVQYLQFAKWTQPKFIQFAIGCIFKLCLQRTAYCRPYYLQMIEDTEIVSRFVQSHLKVKAIEITATTDAKMLAHDIVETFPDIKPQSKEDINGIKWSEIVRQERELWPIHYLLPGGAFIR